MIAVVYGTMITKKQIQILEALLFKNNPVVYINYATCNANFFKLNNIKTIFAINFPKHMIDRFEDLVLDNLDNYILHRIEMEEE